MIDAIDYCPWCWKYGFLYFEYGIGRCICPECHDYVVEHAFDADEDRRPPWQPDARARRQAHLELAGLNSAIAKKIAQLEVGQWDP